MEFRQALENVTTYLDKENLFYPLIITEYREGMIPQTEHNEIFLYYINNAGTMGQGLFNRVIPQGLDIDKRELKFKSKSHLEMQTFNVYTLEMILNDVLIINGIYNVDAKKIIQGNDDISKFVAKKEKEIKKVTKLNTLDDDVSNKFKEYLYSHGIVDTTPYFKVEFVDELNKKQVGFYIDTTTYNTYAGFLYNPTTNTFQKDKVNGDSPTISIKDNELGIIIGEGQKDVFSLINENSSFIINNGIYGHKKTIENLMPYVESQKGIVFLVDKDLAGVYFIYETLDKMYPEKGIKSDFNYFHEQIFNHLNKYLTSDQFKEFIEKLNEYKNMSPVEKIMTGINPKFDSLLEDSFFTTFYSKNTFSFKGSEDFNLTYKMILLLSEHLNVPKASFFPYEIIKNSFEKTLNTHLLNENIFIETPLIGKDFNEHYQKLLMTLDKLIDNNSTYFKDYLPHYQLKSTIQLLSPIEIEQLKIIKENESIEMYIKALKEIIQKKQMLYKDYFELTTSNPFNELTYEKYVAPIEVKESVSNDEEKTLKPLLDEKTLENYMVYGIDEAGMGSMVGPLSSAIAYIDETLFSTYLKEQVLSDTNVVGEDLQKVRMVIETNTDKNKIKKELSSFMNKHLDDKDMPNSLKNFYLYTLIGDSKELNNNQIYAVMEMMKQTNLARIEHRYGNVHNHGEIKQAQKKLFDILSSIPTLLGQDEIAKFNGIKEKTDTSTIAGKLRYKLLDDITTKEKLIIIDGNSTEQAVKTPHQTHFEPKADGLYFQVGLASIVSKYYQLEAIKTITQEFEKVATKITVPEDKKLIETLIGEISSSKGYPTPRHIKAFNDIQPLLLKYPSLEEIMIKSYRNNVQTQDMFTKSKRNNEEMNVEKQII